MTLKRILVTLKSMISDKLALTGALIMNVAPCTFKNMILCFKPMILMHCKLLHEWYGYHHTTFITVDKITHFFTRSAFEIERGHFCF